MTQADRVHSTPPTNTPVDTTRRRFITIAAGASILSVGSLAAVAMRNATPEASSAPVDPVYAAIEAHREAYATMQAVFAEHQRAHDLADAQVGPADLDIPSMVEPGETVEACCRSDIERAVPREQYPDLNAHHNRLLDERKTAHAAIVESLIGDEDEATGEVAGPEFEALQEFAETTPTTLTGLLAMVAFAGEINAEQPDAFADRDTPIFENMATAARAIIGGQS